jgi:hypothetical protein
MSDLSPLGVVRFGECEVRRHSRTYLETVFIHDPGAPVAPATLEFGDPEAVRLAARLGYGTEPVGVERMWLEHELLHTVISEQLGLRMSPALAHVAGVRQTPPDDIRREDAIVHAVQRKIWFGSADDELLQGLSIEWIRGAMWVAKRQLEVK